MKKKAPFLLVPMLIIAASCQTTQTSLYHSSISGTGSIPQPVEEEFPYWARDLRRFEIVSLGTFPFTWLIATTGMDLMRSAQHGWSSQYYPWPAKPAGAPAMTNNEYIITIGSALGLSAFVGLVDFVIIKIKRHKEENKRGSLPQSDPIIIRKPLEEMIEEEQHKK